MRQPGIALLVGIGMISVFHLCEAVAAEAPVKIQLETKDKVILFGLYEKVEKPEAVVILLPMLSKTKASWTKTQEVLAANHFSSFALDLRGHGESISKNGREISWTAFSNKEFSKMLLDVEAAYEFLIQKEGFAPGKVFIIGASIGANTALKFAAEKKSLGGVALLSPGLDYRGVETVPAAKTYGDRPIFYAASREDMSSFETIGHLAQWTPRSTVARLEGMGHGTTMLEKDPLLLDRIILWLKEAASHP